MQSKHLAEMLHDAGLRATQGRIAALRALADSKEPMTHHELFESIKGNRIDRVTVYRMLDTFFESGLVHRIDSGDRSWRFAFCGCGSNIHCHPHFVCESCGKVECLKTMHMPELLFGKSGYHVKGQKIYFEGICPTCIRRNT